jgi:hypothetical protein
MFPHRREARLEATIAALEEERADLTTQLETITLSDTQIATITDFAKEVNEGLEDVGFEHNLWRIATTSSPTDRPKSAHYKDHQLLCRTAG